MSLIDAAVCLYRKKDDEQKRRFFEALRTGSSFENTNHIELWFWACNRWADFPEKEYRARKRMLYSD